MKKFIFILFLFGSILHAQTTWVISPAGDDGTGDGTLPNPWKTFYYAVSQASNGDKIYAVIGTYTETHQIILPVGISLEGQSTGIVRIEVNVNLGTNQPFIKAETTNGWLGNYGNQSIENIIFDGNYPTYSCYAAVYVNYRSNVKIKNCTFLDFATEGVQFFGMAQSSWVADNAIEPGQGKKMPSYWTTGNEVSGCTFTNCAVYSSEGKGNLKIGSQNGMKVFNCTITQVSRASGQNGYGIKMVEGWNKNLDIHDNHIYMAPCASGKYNFGIEIWNDAGGCRYYDNVVTNIDVTNNYKGSSTYSSWFYGNTFGWTSVPQNDERGISLEGFISDCIIEKNIFKYVSTGIDFNMIFPNGEHALYSVMDNIRMSCNIMYNLGCTGTGWTYGVIKGIGFTDYSWKSSGQTVSDIDIINNVIIANGYHKTTTFDGYGIVLPGGIPTTNFNIKNNIIQGFTGLGYSRNAPVGAAAATVNVNLNISYNDFYNNGNSNEVLFTTDRNGGGTYVPSGSYVNTGNITTIPGFVSTTDFHLASDAVGTYRTGIWVELDKDYDDKDFANPPSMGAYEYGTTTGGGEEPPEIPPLPSNLLKSGSRFIILNNRLIKL